jgi:hypothetical protein
MRIVLVVLPVRTIEELTKFEAETRKATEGFAVCRSMCYTRFRIAVLKYQQNGTPSFFTNVLSSQHFVETTDGISTLFRNLQDGADDPEHENKPIDNYESPEEKDEPRKRAKH